MTASFQAKIAWKRMRKRENKYYHSYPTRKRKFQKNRKKFNKLKKNHYGVFSSQNMLGKAERDRK